MNPVIFGTRSNPSTDVHVLQSVQMGEDVKEGRSTLRDLACGRRCCCFFMIFSCCCNCDPHAERDATRKSRVKQCALYFSKIINLSVLKPQKSPLACKS